MEAWNFSRHVVSGALAAAVFTGCAASPIGALPDGGRAAAPLHAGKLNGEVFSATKTSVTCQNSYASMSFTVKGHATGPFSGTFRASGLLTRGSGSQPAAFSESFVIHTGTRAISGKAEGSGSTISLNCIYLTFNVARAHYQADASHGRTQLEYGYPGEFSQDFQ